jgi:hypothetical protein
MHPIKDMLRWPINMVVDAYIKETNNGGAAGQSAMMLDDSQIKD